MHTEQLTEKTNFLILLNRLFNQETLTTEEKTTFKQLFPNICAKMDTSKSKRKCPNCWGKGLMTLNSQGLRRETTCSCVIRYYNTHPSEEHLFLNENDYTLITKLMKNFDNEEKLEKKLQINPLNQTSYEKGKQTENHTEIKFDLMQDQPFEPEFYNSLINHKIKNETGLEIGHIIGFEMINATHLKVNGLVENQYMNQTVEKS